MRHLLSIGNLSKGEIEAILDRAENFAGAGGVSEVPSLRGSTVVTLFYESSTRTSSSFELAAKRLSADLVSVKAAGSSVDKGESLKDTVATLSAYDPAAIVLRHPYAGAAQMVAQLGRGRRHQRRRRQARASQPSAARRLHAAPPAWLPGGDPDLDRRRRPAQPRGPLQPDRLQGDGRRRDRLRPPGPYTAWPRAARLQDRATHSTALVRPMSSTPCASSTSEWVRASFPRFASTRPTSRSTRGGSAPASC